MRIGDGVRMEDRGRIGDGVRMEDRGRIGDEVRMEDRGRIGDEVRMEDKEKTRGAGTTTLKRDTKVTNRSANQTGAFPAGRVSHGSDISAHCRG